MLRETTYEFISLIWEQYMFRKEVKELNKFWLQASFAVSVKHVLAITLCLYMCIYMYISSYR